MWISRVIVQVCTAVFACGALAEEPPVAADPFERTSLVESAEWMGDGMTLELRLAPAPFYRIEVSRQALLETGEAPWLAILTADALSLRYVPAPPDVEALAPASERASNPTRGPDRRLPGHLPPEWDDRAGRAPDTV